MSDKLANMRDVRFVLYEMLDVEKVTRCEYFQDHSRETFEMALEAAYKLAREVCWPCYQECDAIGAQFDSDTNKTTVPEPIHRIWKECREGGWFAPSAPVEHGGQQFPQTVAFACGFLFNAANTAADMYVRGAAGAGLLIESCGSEEQKQKYMMRLYSGEWAGTMALTEPQAGSSLTDIKTTAVKAEDGDHYLITGSKILISSGDHDLVPNIIHPVLAKIPGSPPGIKGISLFIVPKYRLNDDGSVGEFNNVVTGGIEHKMGLRGQATATLNFGENGHCYGWLLGEANKGLKYMFKLMNEARIGTGIQAISQASCAYQNALEYSKERLQGRDLIDRDPAKPQIPIIKHADVKRMLLTQKAYVEGVFSLVAYAAYLGDLMVAAGSDEERERYFDILEILTPVCKAYGSDIGFESIRIAMQCYGGYGYSEEYPIAQLLRDCKVFSIYEGTNNIQAMDLLGRKLVIKQGASFRAVTAEIAKTIEEARGIEALKDMTDKVEAAFKEVVETTTEYLGKIGLGGDIPLYMSYASPYLDMFSQLLVSWQFLWQSIAAQKALDAGTAEEAFYKGKLATARFYIDNELPHAHATAQIIKSGERAALDFQEEWF